MLAYLQGEKAGAAVQEMLEQAEAESVELLMCIINLGEVYYRLRREFGKAAADERLSAIRLLPITVLPVSEELVLEAAALKADYAIAYADCFAVATAAAEKAAVVTGDPDFKKVEKLVSVEWL